MTPREKTVVRAIIKALLRKGTADMDAFASSFYALNKAQGEYYELPPQKRAAILLEALCSAD